MKKALAILAFVLVAATTASAQGNGNGNGQSGWPAYWPSYVLTWLGQGGSIPQPLAIKVIQEARDWGRANYGLSLGQMIQRYHSGELTVEFLQVAPPALIFRVTYGGGVCVILIEDA